MTKCPHSAFVRLHLSIENEPNVVIFIARWAVYLRNHFLLTSSVIFCSKQPFEGSKFGRFNQWDCYTSLQKNLHIFTQAFREGKASLRTTTVYTALEFTMDGWKLLQENLRRQFFTWPLTKEVASWASGAVKITKTPTLCLIQLHLFVEVEPKVVRFIARRAVCFVCPRRREIERPTVWYHKLEKCNP